MINLNKRCFLIFFRFSVFAFMAGLLTSCNEKSSTILLDTSCEPPCWHQIIPGSSTRDVVDSALPNIPEVDVNSIREAAITTGGIYNHIMWQFNEVSGDYSGAIYFQDGVVSSISILPKAGALTLEDAIQVLGEPEYTFVYKERGEVTRMIIYLLAPTKGFVLVYDKIRSQSRIEPRDSIEFVYYFNPEQFNAVVTSNLLMGQDLATLEKHQRPWEGYGEIYYFEQTSR